MESLNVALGARTYPILIGAGLLGSKRLLSGYFQSIHRVAIVSNVTVAPLYLPTLRTLMEHLGITVSAETILPDGEIYKNWETLNMIFDALLAGCCERSTTLIALGGGVVGDMTGFAAACYQRGIPFIQIPTTLLAQVDSSVGGKTAINHPLGKNMIGAFYQPHLVLADTDVLKTLSDRELRAGLAEVVKYALIRDMAFLDWLETHLDALLNKDSAALEYAIYRSCQHKAEIVANDEQEHGERALLNLGHTFGHAIETGLGYGAWLHGEAVAAGILMAAELSADQGWLSRGDIARIEQLFVRIGLPVRGPAMPVDRYLELMWRDKKVQGGKMRLVLLKRLGEALIVDTATPTAISNAICARS